MLSRCQKYDYHDIDRTELFLIKVGHACWATYEREKRVLGPHALTTKAYLEACESVWEAKQKYRLELKARKSAEWQANKGRFLDKQS